MPMYRNFRDVWNIFNVRNIFVLILFLFLTVIGLNSVVASEFNQSNQWSRAPYAKILNAKNANLMIWSVEENPDILIFDFPGLGYQGKSFNRITQFTEQQFTEEYPRVLNNYELDQYMLAVRRTQSDFAFGHDILVSEFVRFFNYAIRDKIQLNIEELFIRDFLEKNNLIRFWRGFYQAMKPDVVVLAIPQSRMRNHGEPVVSDGARLTVLTHEMAHAEYYTNTYYRKFCQNFWRNTLDDRQRELFSRFLMTYNYSINNEELLINEMQAYLMFTPDEKSFSAKKLGVSEEELSVLRANFKKNAPLISILK